MNKLNQKGVVHLVIPVLLLLLVGIVVGVYLITNGNPLKLFTRATTPPIVFKHINGSSLPTNSGGVSVHPVSGGTNLTVNVLVELTSPLGPPASVSAPNARRTTSYKVAEEAAGLNAAPSQPYNTEPKVFIHDFVYSLQPCHSIQKFLWVEFRANDGSIDRRTAQIVLENSCDFVSGPISPTPSGNVGIGATSPGPSIKITYPNGGEVFNVGDKVRITWTSNKTDQVNLGYSFGPGSLNPITSFISSQDYYDWVVNIGNTNNTKVKIDVLGYGPEGQSNDQSDDFFTVLTPGIEVDKISVVVTLNKTDVQQNGLIYGSGFTITSTGATDWQIKYNEPTQGQGFYESSGGTTLGRSDTIRSYINANKADGVYSGSAVVQYYQNDKWHDGPTVSYNITVVGGSPASGGSGGSGGGSSGGGGGQSQPVIKTISQFRVAESPTEFQDNWQAYYQGIVVPYTFKPSSIKTKSIFIQFRDDQRQIVKINGQDYIQSSIELVEEQQPPAAPNAPIPRGEDVVVGTASVSSASNVSGSSGNWNPVPINLSLSGFSTPGRSIAGLFVRNQTGECSISSCGYIGWTQIRSYGSNGTDSTPWTAPSGFSSGVHMFAVFSLNADGTAGTLLDVSATNFTTSSSFAPPPPPPSTGSCQANVTTCSCSDPDPASSRYPGKCYPECNGGWCNGGICSTCQP